MNKIKNKIQLTIWRLSSWPTNSSTIARNWPIMFRRPAAYVRALLSWTVTLSRLACCCSFWNKKISRFLWGLYSCRDTNKKEFRNTQCNKDVLINNGTLPRILMGKGSAKLTWQNDNHDLWTLQTIQTRLKYS